VKWVLEIFLVNLDLQVGLVERVEKVKKVQLANLGYLDESKTRTIMSQIVKKIQRAAFLVNLVHRDVGVLLVNLV